MRAWRTWLVPGWKPIQQELAQHPERLREEGFRCRELRYQATSWAQPRRGVLVLVPSQTEELPIARHFFLITDQSPQTMGGRDVVAFYRQRGLFERMLGEAALHPSAPALLDHPSAPALLDHPSAPALLDHPSAPALLDHPSAPALLDHPSAPALLDHLQPQLSSTPFSPSSPRPPFSPSSPRPPFSPALLDHPSAPALLDHPSAPALLDHPSAPALLDHPSHNSTTAVVHRVSAPRPGMPSPPTRRS